MVDIVTPLVIGSLTVATWSLMYKENEAYRIAEDLTVGVMAGYVFYVGVNNVNTKNIQPLLQGDWTQLIAIALGILLWLQMIKSLRRYSRYSMAILSGVGTALALTGVLQGQILAPIRGLFLPPGADLMTKFTHLVSAIAAITTVMYFFYAIKPSGVMKPVSMTGRWFIYIALGSIAGSMVVSNATFIYDRAQWFLYTPYAWIPLVVACVVIIYDIARNR